jgi:nickel superoxide dismutase
VTKLVLGAVVVVVLWALSCVLMMLVARRLPEGLLRQVAEFLPSCVTTARRLRKHPDVPRSAKVADNDDPDFRTRAVLIKEQRSELVKHHLWVLWTDYFKAPHFEKYPQLHTLFNEATKLAGASGTKGTLDADAADQLLAKIDEIAEICWETKKA